MTVRVLMPVFNRKAETAQALDYLRAQVADEPLDIIVVDDGSSDGTPEYLAAQNDIKVVQGDGNLWWAGAVDKGLKLVLAIAGPLDWVLLVNNDTGFASDFVQKLLDTARANRPAAVGSVICDKAAPERLLSIGAEFDTWRLHVGDRLEQTRQWHPDNEVHEVDALSGRGTLYPLSAFHAVGGMNPAWLPHYLADYELAVRVRKAGYRLLVSERAVTLSADEYGNESVPVGAWDRFFAIRSAHYVPAKFIFWWRASSLSERVTLLPRLFLKNLKLLRTQK